jgi:hypothetical protein
MSFSCSGVQPLVPGWFGVFGVPPPPAWPWSNSSQAAFAAEETPLTGGLTLGNAGFGRTGFAHPQSDREADEQAGDELRDEVAHEFPGDRDQRAGAVVAALMAAQSCARPEVP